MTIFIHSLTSLVYYRVFTDSHAELIVSLSQCSSWLNPLSPSPVTTKQFSSWFFLPGYLALRTQVKCDPRDILQFRLKGLSLHYTEINSIIYAVKNSLLVTDWLSLQLTRQN